MDSIWIKFGQNEDMNCLNVFWISRLECLSKTHGNSEFVLISQRIKFDATFNFHVLDQGANSKSVSSSKKYGAQIHKVYDPIVVW